MKTFFFTFGQNRCTKDMFVAVIAPDSEQARKAMFHHFGEKWAFQYDGPINFRKQMAEFRLYPLLTMKVISAEDGERVYTERVPFGEFQDVLAEQEGLRRVTPPTVIPFKVS